MYYRPQHGYDFDDRFGEQDQLTDYEAFLQREALFAPQEGDPLNDRQWFADQNQEETSEDTFSQKEDEVETLQKPPGNQENDPIKDIQAKMAKFTSKIKPFGMKIPPFEGEFAYAMKLKSLHKQRSFPKEALNKDYGFRITPGDGKVKSKWMNFKTEVEKDYSKGGVLNLSVVLSNMIYMNLGSFILRSIWWVK